MIKLIIELRYKDELAQSIAIWEYHTAAFSAKAAAKPNARTNLKKVKEGFPKCEYYIKNYHSENCWTKYPYKK